MLIFILGPSRGGKSTLLNHLRRQVPTLRVEDLDAIENQEQGRLKRDDGWTGRWNRSATFLEELQRQDAVSHSQLVLVDVGAGTLQTNEGVAYFLARMGAAILVEAPFETILKRHERRNADELRRTEFSQRHEKLYASLRAKGQVVDTASGSVAESAEQLLGLIHAICARDRQERD